MSWRSTTLHLTKKIPREKTAQRLLSEVVNSACYTGNDHYSSSGKGRDEKSNWNSYGKLAAATALSSLGALYYFFHTQSGDGKVYALLKTKTENPGEFKENLKTYTVEEVGKHDNEESGIWITYKRGVYDISKFVSQHPGGSSKIMMAAGSSIEPFWQIFANHNSKEIYALLESMRIGNLEESHEDSASSESDDPYRHEPKRHKALKINGPKPFCAEPPSSMLVENFYTPTDLFYVRNHLPVPVVDIKDYELEIAIEDDTKRVLDISAIKKYPKYTITTAIMCGGNRRSEMAEAKPLKGLSWGVGAVGNASWSGARLCDVLEGLNINEDDWNHVQFEGLDTDPAGIPYGASIPIGKALDPRAEVILAYEMNGEPISRDHGFPIRAIVPGVVGARNVKWLGKIVISKEESSSQFQRGDYKGFSPSIDWHNVDFSKAPAIQEMPVVSAICTPQRGEQIKLENGKIPIKGYAWSGGGNRIIRVDITLDGGETWHEADLVSQDKKAREGRHWGWTIWKAEIPVDSSAKEVEIWAKAVDSSYNVQPESFKNIWNLRGFLCNAYHRVKVRLDK
ncbi:sulfite oxidase, mitochondrial isoform X2 [Venturia canescens]|uniref:sulfite oxidase, mitochondrial isoform X2 n=1 Tax=Venturia canescens TaxID=32260 RepID=UPI001C9CF23C|nr:sulfite oxidase, mitochondrial isoform X2 [Venturia canescens]